jgi:hypothetical protein
MVGATLTGMLEHRFKKFSKAKSSQSLKVKRESLQARKTARILEI